MTYTGALAQEIRAELARRQMSRQALIDGIHAELPGSPSAASIYRMIRGQYPWDVDTLEAAAKVLHLTMGDLIERAGTVNRCNLPLLSVATFPQVSGLLLSAQ